MVTRVVLSIGSNLGDRLGWLQSALNMFRTFGEVTAVSPVYETDPWGGVEQGAFLNAVLIAQDPACDEHEWLCRAQAAERAAGRLRGERWGPRTLDVDLITCHRTVPGGTAEIISRDADLTLPHPRVEQRAFVMVPWLAVDPDAELTLAAGPRSVAELLAELDPAERESVRLYPQVLGS